MEEQELPPMGLNSASNGAQSPPGASGGSTSASAASSVASAPPSVTPRLRPLTSSTGSLGDDRTEAETPPPPPPPPPAEGSEAAGGFERGCVITAAVVTDSGHSLSAVVSATTQPSEVSDTATSTPVKRSLASTGQQTSYNSNRKEVGNL